MTQSIIRAIEKGRSILRNSCARPVSRMAYTMLDQPRELTVFRDKTNGKFIEKALTRCWYISNRLTGAASDRVAGYYESHAGPYGVEIPVPWDIEFDVTPSTNNEGEGFQKSKPNSDKKDNSNIKTR